jgi:hypothetical protein
VGVKGQIFNIPSRSAKQQGVFDGKIGTNCSSEMRSDTLLIGVVPDTGFRHDRSLTRFLDRLILSRRGPCPAEISSALLPVCGFVQLVLSLT